MIVTAKLTRRSFIALAGAVTAAATIPAALAKPPAQGGFHTVAPERGPEDRFYPYKTPCTAQLLNARGEVVLRDATVTSSEVSDASISLRATFPVYVAAGHHEVTAVQILRDGMILLTTDVEPFVVCAGITVQADVEARM